MACPLLTRESIIKEKNMSIKMSGMSRGWFLGIFLLIVVFSLLWLFFLDYGNRRSDVPGGILKENYQSGTTLDTYPVEIMAQTIITGKIISMTDRSLGITTEDGQVDVALDPETAFHTETCRAMTEEERGAVTDVETQNVCSALPVDRSALSTGLNVSVVLRLDSTIAELVIISRE